MQTYTLHAASTASIHCLFCGQEVIPDLHDEDGEVNPCEHTLFVAHPEGCEHLDPRLEDALEARGIHLEDDCFVVEDEADEEEAENGEEGLDTDDSFAVLTAVSFPDEIVIIRSSGSSEGLEVWVGFAPTLD